MEPLSIKFVDFWPGFDENSNFFVDFLSQRYDLKFVRNNPELLIYSCFGDSHKKYCGLECAKIFLTGENATPDFDECDYAFGFDYIEFGDRYLRYPLFAMHGALEAVKNRTPISQADIKNRTRFCNFIYSNRHAAPIRDRTFQALSAYRPVDSAGKHLRNVFIDEDNNIIAGRGRPNEFRKTDFQKNYRFSIAFENSEHPGYTTEKILDAFAARTIPIYWGNPLVLRDFNPESFINAYDFEDINALVAEVARIDNDPDTYLSMINAPVFSNAYLERQPFRAQVEAFLADIVAQPRALIRRRPKSGWARHAELSRDTKHANFFERFSGRSKGSKGSHELPGYHKIR